MFVKFKVEFITLTLPRPDPDPFGSTLGVGRTPGVPKGEGEKFAV